MATAGFKLCGICEMRQKTNEATVWCPECEDPLCADCKENHRISKASRSHTTVPINDYQKLPSFILDAKMFCEEHDEKFHHYCMRHERPLCKTCIVREHAACKDLKIIEDVIGNCKSSFAMEAVEKDLKDILSSIQRLKQDRDSNLSAIKGQKSAIIRLVSGLRDKINQHLDRIEKAFLAELSSVANENQKRITDLLISLTSKESSIEELLDSIRGIKKHASDFQTFIGMKEIEKRIHEDKQYIRSIFESSKQIELCCSFDSSLKNLTTNAKKMGTLSAKENPSLINLDIESSIQAQIKSPTNYQNNELRLKLDHQINISNHKNDEITCCFTTSNGEHVFGFIGRLDIYLSDLSFMHDISLDGRYPANITETNSRDLVAVGTGFHNVVLIIDIIKNTILKKINTEDRFWGITFRGGSLIYCTKGIGLNTTDMRKSPPCTKCIYEMNIETPSFVKVINDKICITDTINSIVKILGPDMREIFHSSNRPDLPKPSYITMDEFGYIYIANMDSPCNVLVLTPNGQQCQLLELNKCEVFCGLSYDVTTGRLVVATNECKVLFYKICQY